MDWSSYGCSSDLLRDIVDEIARAAVLERLAVQSGLHGDVARIAEHIDSHHPRPEASGVAKIFPRCDLTRMELPVAAASVVKGGISRYIPQGILLGDPTADLADDHGAFRPHITGIRHAGLEERRKMGTGRRASG